MQISSSKVRPFLQTLAVEDASILCKLALSKLTHSLFNVYHVFDLNLASVYQLPATQFPPGVTLRLFRGARGYIRSNGADHGALDTRAERGLA